MSIKPIKLVHKTFFQYVWREKSNYFCYTVKFENKFLYEISLVIVVEEGESKSNISKAL